MTTKSPSSIVTSLFYALACVTLLGAIILLISAVGFKSSLGTSLNVFTAAFGPISDVFVGLLTNALQWLGVLFAGMMFVVSFLLCTAGRMTRRAQDLSQRLVSLEAKVADLEGKK